MTDSKLSIYRRIAAVQSKVSYIKKTRKVQNYLAVGHDDVIRMVRDHMIANGVMITESLISDQVVSTGTMTSSGTPIIRYEALFEIRFINVFDGSDYIVLVVPAHANDTGDKAPGKAMSYAEKSALLKMFLLETGEHDEERIEGEPSPLSEEQVIQLEGMCEEFGFPAEETLKALAQKVYKINDISELPSTGFDNAVKRLKKKAADAKRNAKKEPEKRDEPAADEKIKF